MKIIKLVSILSLICLSSQWEVDFVPCTDPNCLTCDSTSTTCLTCDNLYYPNDVLSQCSLCDIIITNCTQCSANSSQAVICQACDTGFYLYNGGAECRTCLMGIYDCSVCSLDSSQIVTCDQCLPGELPSLNALACKTCFGLISNCLTCQPHAKYQPTTCITCQSGYNLSGDQLTCSLPDNQIWIVIVAVCGGVLLLGGSRSLNLQPIEEQIEIFMQSRMISFEMEMFTYDFMIDFLFELFILMDRIFLSLFQ